MRKSTVGSIIVGLVTLNSALFGASLPRGRKCRESGRAGVYGVSGSWVYRGSRGWVYRRCHRLSRRGYGPWLRWQSYLGMRRFGADIRSPRPNTVDNPNANVHRMGVGWDNPLHWVSSEMGPRLLEWPPCRRPGLASFGRRQFGCRSLRARNWHGQDRLGAFVLDVRPSALQFRLLEL